MEFELGDRVWFKGRKCIIADKLRNMYALSDESGKDVKGEINEWWVSEHRLSVRLKED
jgi:hypothetical protein